MTFTAGTASVDYTQTFVLVGNGTPKTTSSPALSIAGEKKTWCLLESDSTICLKLKTTWTDPADGSKFSKTVCWKLICELCPSNPD